MPVVTTQYRVVLTCSGQSANSVAATVTVSPTASVVSYATPPATATFCTSGTQAVVTATPAGGTFSAPTGLSINAITGALNLSASTAGTYTVTYSPPSGSCASPGTTTVTLTAPVTPTLSFGGTTFCKAGAAPVTTAAPTGGAFSSTTGLVINASTGAVDLAASTNGTYTVSYTSPGVCGGTVSTRITIQGNSAPVYPNVLTPNGDKLNDELKLKIADVQNYSLKVFNRWGRRVYEGNSATEGWNPADNSAGTYYYQVEYTDCAGRAQMARNWIEVIK
jgi:gliding motility-associated-like protein